MRKGMTETTSDPDCANQTSSFTINLLSIKNLKRVCKQRSFNQHSWTTSFSLTSEKELCLFHNNSMVSTLYSHP